MRTARARGRPRPGQSKPFIRLRTTSLWSAVLIWSRWRPVSAALRLWPVFKKLFITESIKICLFQRLPPRKNVRPNARQASIYQPSRRPRHPVNKSLILSAIVNIL
jgi:hypothetical protein